MSHKGELSASKLRILLANPVWYSLKNKVLVLALAGFGAFCLSHAHLTWPQSAWSQEAQKSLDESSIRVRVSMVDIPVVVENASGELVTDLTQDNFQLFDKGAQQNLLAIDVGGAPPAVVVVVETSSRIAELLPFVRRTGRLFTESVIGEAGEVALIAYNDEVDKVLDFTADHEAFVEALAALQPGTSGAYLYDALGRAINTLLNVPPSRRRVIIMMAEAFDTGSEEKLSTIVTDAQTNDITIYSVGLSTTVAEARGPRKQAEPLRATPVGTQGLPPLPGTANTPTVEQLRGGSMDVGALARHAWSFVSRQPSVETAVAATGGLYQSTFREASVEKAIGRIADELHSQYTLSYLPYAQGEKGGFHQIKVVVVGQPTIFKVRSRPGYFASLPKNGR